MRPDTLPKSPVHTKRWRLLETIVEVAPDASGVYALWKGGEIIYYGRATVSIRACLSEHLRGERGMCTGKATHYSWELCNRPAPRESELLSEFWAVYSRFPGCNEAETISRAMKKSRA
jgi:hypothetical protein